MEREKKKKDEKVHISNLQCILKMDNMPENKEKNGPEMNVVSLDVLFLQALKCFRSPDVPLLLLTVLVLSLK